MAIYNCNPLTEELKAVLHWATAAGPMLFITATLFAADKPAEPAVAAIDAAIQSLRAEPNQFLLNVTSVGMISTASGPGSTGTRVEVHGGGPGSQTTGITISAGSGQIEIARTMATEALHKESEKAIQLLTEIKALLEKPKAKIDKATVLARLSEFGKTYVAPALKTVIETLVKKAVGP